MTLSISDLIVGNELSMSCLVNGGKPAVSVVSIDCGSRQSEHTDNVTSNTYTTTSLTWILEPQDNGIECVCTAEWIPNMIMYSKTAIKTLDVECKLNVC